MQEDDIICMNKIFSYLTNKEIKESVLDQKEKVDDIVEY
jgi:hypothetical protein